MNHLAKNLDDLRAQNRYRKLKLPHGIDLSSNDYLGMVNHPVLRDAAIMALKDGLDLGAGGSRLLRGHTQAHQDLEDFAAAHFAAPRTLFFATGFQANYALLTTLPDRNDIILYDSLIHASMRDGIQASSAKSFKFAHNDLAALETLLKTHAGKSIWIAVESVYSMDGDTSPLTALYALAEKYNAMLIVDEAHGTGVFGRQGKGLCCDLIQKDKYHRLITLHTCGKAIGVAGGLVCAKDEIIETLINRARGFIYSTAPMPLQALLVQKSLEVIASKEGDKLRDKLFILCGQAKEFFGGAGTQIVPIILKDDDSAMRVAAALQDKGFDIRAIRPPSVPEGTARLRLSLSSNLSASILQDLATALQQIMERDRL